MRLFEITRKIIRNPNKLPPSVPSQEHLYHGTSMNHLGLIVKSNSLWQGIYWHKPGEPHGVRCTRSLKSAEPFAFEQETPGGILVLNWPKIAQRYKTIPYVDTQYNDSDPTQPGAAWGADEAEEVILTAALKPLSSFLESILMRKKEYDQLKSGEYLKDEWLEDFSAYGGQEVSVHRRAIEALMAYPNIKAI